MKRVTYRKVGGLHFVTVLRLQFSFCVRSGEKRNKPRKASRAVIAKHAWFAGWNQGWDAGARQMLHENGNIKSVTYAPVTDCTCGAAMLQIDAGVGVLRQIANTAF